MVPPSERASILGADQPRTRPVARERIVGRRLIRIAQTKWSDPVTHLPGIGDAFYCTVVLEIEGSGLFVLADESIGSWTSSEPLFDANLDEHDVETTWLPIGAKIADVVADQLGELSVVFDNDTFAAISSGYGWYLRIGDLAALLKSDIDGAPVSLIDWWSGESFQAKAER